MADTQTGDGDERHPWVGGQQVSTASLIEKGVLLAFQLMRGILQTHRNIT